MKPNARQNPNNANVRIGHVHLKVADLDRALAFYRDVLGFDVTQRFGSQASGALSTRSSPTTTRKPGRTVGSLLPGCFAACAAC
jgi:catechol 2,3-dioxygenase-like lactoylglutathione lyase family enzyme